MTTPASDKIADLVRRLRAFQLWAGELVKEAADALEQQAREIDRLREQVRDASEERDINYSKAMGFARKYDAVCAELTRRAIPLPGESGAARGTDTSNMEV